jgi:hypothetical protein
MCKELTQDWRKEQKIVGGGGFHKSEKKRNDVWVEAKGKKHKQRAHTNAMTWSKELNSAKASPTKK